MILVHLSFQFYYHFLKKNGAKTLLGKPWVNPWRKSGANPLLEKVVQKTQSKFKWIFAPLFLKVDKPHFSIFFNLIIMSH